MFLKAVALNPIFCSPILPLHTSNYNPLLHTSLYSFQLLQHHLHNKIQSAHSQWLATVMTILSAILLPSPTSPFAQANIIDRALAAMEMTQPLEATVCVMASKPFLLSRTQLLYRAARVLELAMTLHSV